jgi:peptidoglycan/LPS O-acetylase OafA/YrhL
MPKSTVCIAAIAAKSKAIVMIADELFGLEYSLLAVFYFLLLISVLINPKLEKIFSMKALCYMGTIAYGLCLLHVPFIGAVGGIARWIDPRQSGWLALFVSVSGIGLATVAAVISWEYLEKPLIKRGHRYRYGKAENVPGNVLVASQTPSTLSLR